MSARLIELSPHPGPAPQRADSRAAARSRMRNLGLWHDGQHMGRRWAVGCVAVEVTQRCNLDCTLCYLSESSEALHDLPLEEIFRRLRAVRDCYGPGVDIQITGGEPTLRSRDELVAVVRYARALDLRPALFTNGIRATRPLLESLSGAGLVDVAFHVDMTQLRKGFRFEAELNAVRAEYIERARGLPLAVYFNTTIFDGNLDEIEDVVRFFVANADVVRLASFQLQADTGRGVHGRRGAGLGTDAVIARIRAGTGTSVRFDAFDFGHPACNRYAMTLVANRRVHDLLDDPGMARRVLEATADLGIERTAPWRAAVSLALKVLRTPRLVSPALAWAARKLWRMKGDLLSSRGRAHKLSFFIHDFMDACDLAHERIAACAFMVASADGPISMCLHNAERDAHLLTPARIDDTHAVRWWNPVSGRLQDKPLPPRAPVLTRKTARGRAKIRIEAAP